MSLLRPLDPTFTIERQIAIDAGPVHPRQGGRAGLP
jgi:hypothetical protein